MFQNGFGPTGTIFTSLNNNEIVIENSVFLNL